MKLNADGRKAFIDSLLDFAAFVETMPEDLPLVSEIPTINVGLDWRKFKGPDGEMYDGGSPEGLAIVAKMLGHCDKNVTEQYFSLERKFGTAITVHWFTSRNAVCERVKVGTRMVPPTEERVIPAQPAREEDVYEYRCPSLFKALPRGQAALPEGVLEGEYVDAPTETPNPSERPLATAHRLLVDEDIPF